MWAFASPDTALLWLDLPPDLVFVRIDGFADPIGVEPGSLCAEDWLLPLSDEEKDFEVRKTFIPREETRVCDPQVEEPSFGVEAALAIVAFFAPSQTFAE